MKAPYVPDMVFVGNCPACRRRFRASSLVVLDAKMTEHMQRCFPATKKAIDQREADDRQGDLFGGDP